MRSAMKISECQEVDSEAVVVEGKPEALLMGLPEEGGTAVITKIATTKTTKTSPKKLSEGEDLDVMTQLQRTTEMLLDSNVNNQQDLENMLLILRPSESLAKFHMHIQKQFLLKRMLSVQA